MFYTEKIKGGAMSKKKTGKIKKSKPDAKNTVNNAVKEPESLPESIAEDICTVISESKAELKKEEKMTAGEKKLGIRGILLVVTFAIFLYWALNNLSSIGSAIKAVISLLSPFIIGFAIAFIINAVLVPLEKAWNRIFNGAKEKPKDIAKKLKRPVCLVLSTVIVIGVIFAIIFMVIPELKVTISAFADKLPGFISKLNVWFTQLSEILAKYKIELPETTFNADKILDALNSFITKRGEFVLDKTVDITSSIFSVIFNTVLAFVFSMYLLSQKEKVSKKATGILYATMRRKNADLIIRICSLTNSTFTKFVTGQLTEAVIIGFLCFIGMLLFDMPYAPVISVLIGATALIPIFGAFIGTAIGAVLILSVDFMTAVWFVVFIIVLQQLESNLIYPRVVGKSVGLPGILVLSAVTLGGGLFGFVGILLGVPVCSVLYCIFNEFIAKRLEEKGNSVCKKL